MKKINSYSAQYKFIQPHQNHPSHKNNQNPNKKKLTYDSHDFVNNIAASGFKQFHA